MIRFLILTTLLSSTLGLGLPIRLEANYKIRNQQMGCFVDPSRYVYNYFYGYPRIAPITKIARMAKEDYDIVFQHFPALAEGKFEEGPKSARFATSTWSVTLAGIPITLRKVGQGAGNRSPIGLANKLIDLINKWCKIEIGETGHMRFARLK